MWVWTGVPPALQAAVEEQLCTTNLQNGYKKTASELGISEENEVELSLLGIKPDLWEDAGRLPSLQRVR